MEKSLSVRPAKLEDLDILLTFEQGVIDAERPMDPYLKNGEMTYYNIPQLILQENTYFVVAVFKNELIASGYVKIENSRNYHKNPQNGYVGFMYVTPKFRGKRISNVILASLKDWAKTKNLKELRLDVYSNNPAAIKSYERFGFKNSMINMRMEIK